MLHDVKTITILCPQCKKPSSLSEDNLFRPFCSERCKLIDLGSWASEEYAIPTDDGLPTDQDDEDL